MLFFLLCTKKIVEKTIAVMYLKITLTEKRVWQGNNSINNYGPPILFRFLIGRYEAVMRQLFAARKKNEVHTVP
jgi:hypothetical protein